MMIYRDRKAVWGWALYDWANSAFATTVMAAFFPLFFREFWSADASAVVGTAKVGIANSLAGLIIAVTAPILGAIADKGFLKKRFLFCFAVTGIFMTFSFFFIPQGSWLLAMGAYIIAVAGFSGANVFYDSLITAVSSEQRFDIVSSLGYGMGYLGGGILFAFNIAMVLKPHLFGFSNSIEAIKVCFLTVSIWWSIFSLPLFIFVREPSAGLVLSVKKALCEGLAELSTTFRNFRHLKAVWLFLGAYWFYIDGVNTIIRMALDYGMAIGFAYKNLIVALLITQFIGFPSAIFFGYLGKKIGARRAIFIAISVYIGVSCWAVFIHHEFEFYALAVTIGLVQGGIQALSRSLYARIIPANKSAEFFGFYNMVSKFSVIIGPLFIAAVSLLVQAAGATGTTASRSGIASVSFLFLAGACLLACVKEEEGKSEARFLT